ncbi:hypothetical protein UFOVP180_34 [uncultured Caudovirales phage]|uniref:Uncharacterized protein n=1 Tax=uncultured Caudovirales phage TaxID=2100421 RepID=A0A6J7WHV7_9CAUD|nr:hypothetical protein UFOVP180_34 [uncultured Caudovirales phage]
MSMWDNIFGTQAAQGLQGQLANSAQGLSAGQLAAQNYYNTLAAQNYAQAMNNAQQAQQISQQAQYAQYNANRQTYNWVWNGKPVGITEFAELAYGDTPQKTMFLLKHSEDK